MAYAINAAITGTFTLLDQSSPPAGITGATFATKTAILSTNEATTATLTVTELSGGKYRFSFTPTAVGDWDAVVVYNAGGLYRRLEGTYTVDAPGATGVTGVTLLAGPIEVNGTRTIYKRTDYKNADARSLDWTTADDATWPDLTGATIAFASRAANGDATAGIAAAGAVIAATGAKQVRVELTRTATANAKPGLQTYQLRATLTNGDVISLASGQVKIIDYLG